MFDINMITDALEWRQAIQNFPEYDFGHTYDFHKISEKNGEGKAVLFVVREQNNPVLCWPGLMRPVAQTDLYDMTSVLEYSGPLIKSKELAESALSYLFSALSDRNIICVFTKLHPMIESLETLSSDDIEDIGNVVVIDIREQDRILEHYRSNHRRDIKKAKTEGVNIVIGDPDRDLDEFIRLYRHAMRVLGARDYYMFSRDYLASLLNSVDFEAILMFAIWENKKIGTIMLLKSKNIIHYYLGGIDEEFKHLSPLKVLLARGHQFAIDNKVDYFVLGGGPGGSEGPLIHFKKGFGKLIRPFLIYKKILNDKEYLNSCQAAGINPDDTHFFPAYRTPI